MFLLGIVVLLFAFRVFVGSRRRNNSVAFFHPYADGGAGGERVLFEAIRAIFELKEGGDKRFDEVYLYVRDSGKTKEEILRNVLDRFNITLNSSQIQFITLRSVFLMKPANFPFCTLFFQCCAEFLVGCEALYKINPEYFFDTVGCPFTLPLFKWLAGSKVICYVHYPTITKNMIKRVEEGEQLYNNRPVIANSDFLTTAKYYYYRFFACIYWFCGLSANVVMVNSSWTCDHIKNLWPVHSTIVFPPVDFGDDDFIANYTEIPHNITIISVGQIRPEKNHRLQLDILKALIDSPDLKDFSIKLRIAGGCRDEDDHARVDALKQHADELGISDSVIWSLNVPREELFSLYRNSFISLHTMFEEHFGIAIVEAMAVGSLMIANRSGGPKADIVEEGVSGWLACDLEEYVTRVVQILNSEVAELNEVRVYASSEVMTKFGAEKFKESFCKCIADI